MDKYANIIVSLRSNNVDKIFTYRVPHDMEIQAGSRVIVPFAGQRLEGYCISLKQDAGHAADAYKNVEEVLDETPILTEELLELSDWGASRWLCRRVDFLQAMVPAGLRWSTRKWVSLNESAITDTPALLWLYDNGPVKLAGWQKKFPENTGSSELRRLLQRGIISINSRETRGVGQKLALTAYLVKRNCDVPVGQKQGIALRLLKTHGKMTLTALEAEGVSRTTVRSLEKKGWVEVREQSVRRDPLSGETFSESAGKVSLTTAQANALQQISAAVSGEVQRTVLLHGVTGSGKTEVYLQAIARTAALGKGSIVLVPEIALTPQMIERFSARFGSRVAVLHSRLSAGERYDEWARISSGEALIAVGARSAVFAPFRKLGLIVLDEEHEASYKQDESPRYHARDVALWRAKQHRAALVLGSATPSLESYRAALGGDYLLCSMPERVANRPLPPVEVVDMRQELKEGHRSIFSRSLLSALTRTLLEKKQAILLLNRRGYATFVLCRECGHVMRCRQCNVSLKFHMAQETLRCHYCDHSELYPVLCPSCGGRYIRHFGTGTQKVEEELHKHYPAIRAVRLDADTTTRKGAHQKILSAFKTGQADVLIGTQMVAKGLDFPNVTLVGVITADTSINLPDFRAGERTFQLLTQVAGRAGRGLLGGQVVVQTYSPDHYAVQAAKNHDYALFYGQESMTREELEYPPYSVFIRLLITGSTEGAVTDAASFIVSLLGEDADILGPSPCPIERIKGRFRWQVVVRGQTLDPLLVIVREAADAFAKSPLSGSVRLLVDVEPQSLL